MSNELYAGVDIGGTKISALILDSKGKVLGRNKKKTRAEKGFAAVIERTADCIGGACEDADISSRDVTAVGLGAPSPILPNGTAVAAPNMGWTNVPLGPALSTKVGCPVFAENDCNAGTYGEFALGGHGNARTLVGMFMGTGLGGGIVLDGNLITGDNNMAAEVGHLTVEVGGRPCNCGKRGCLEAYASKVGMGYAFKQAIVLEKRYSVLTELVEDARYDNVRSALLRKAWDADDEVAQETLRQAAYYLGLGVGNLITLLGPEVVVLGGGVFDALGDELIPIVRSAAREHVFPRKSFEDTSIELATLGDDAVAFGAMAYARSRIARG